ncbi:MAG: asparagine synthase (glutamine-hydrolyzing), partial [Bacteroidota bacterium]
MCGIIGQLNRDKRIDEAEFTRMRDTLIHRGPDDAGNWFNAQGNVALGHRRLSFLDLSEAGRQPMTNEDNSLWLTFNGEIYNYVELRETLLQKGHTFRSTSDSEVLLHGYEEWGTGLFNRLKGMFAFGIYDDRKGELILVRDRFGIKPLYYHHAPGRFIFASEIKGIVACSDVKPELDTTSMWDYFAFRYVPSPKSIWKNVAKVPPAHYLRFRMGKAPEVVEYWTVPIGEKRQDTKALAEEMEALLQESVKQHIRADVPVGSFLSGGYDSSALVYFLHRLKYPTQTFAIGFEGWDNSEHQYAELVAETFGTNHTNRIVETGSLDLVEKLMYHYDEPIADISIIPTYLISQEARRNVKTVLSGEGADEMFCGYTWQRDYKARWGKLGWLRRWREAKGWVKRPFGVDRYGEAMAMGRFENAELRSLFHGDLRPEVGMDADWFYGDLHRKDLSPLKSVQFKDIKAFMGELVLVKIDRASMAHSLEVRVPFLDHE